MIIDFYNHFSEKIDILKTIPEQEYENLSLKLIGLLIKLIELRSFTNEGSVEERMKRFEEKSNPFEKFIKEFCDSEDPEGYIFKYDFEKKFHSFCKDNRFRTFSDVSIGKEMKIRGFEQQKKMASWLNDGNGGMLRAWIGLKWKE